MSGFLGFDSFSILRGVAVNEYDTMEIDYDNSIISCEKILLGGVDISNFVGVPGPPGPPGANATINIGTVTSLGSDENASVQNSGSATNAILNFGIPRGQNGQNAIAPTISIGTVTTLDADQDATIENVGTSTNLILDFGIPHGRRGPEGPQGEKSTVPGPKGQDSQVPGPRGEPGSSPVIAEIVASVIGALGFVSVAALQAELAAMLVSIETMSGQILQLQSKTQNIDITTVVGRTILSGILEVAGLNEVYDAIEINGNFASISGLQEIASKQINEVTRIRKKIGEVLEIDPFKAASLTVEEKLTAETAKINDLTAIYLASRRVFTSTLHTLHQLQVKGLTSEDPEFRDWVDSVGFEVPLTLTKFPTGMEDIVYGTLSRFSGSVIFDHAAVEGLSTYDQRYSVGERQLPAGQPADTPNRSNPDNNPLSQTFKIFRQILN
jgi:uncharacterized protein YunC (DUF1805 family)